MTSGVRRWVVVLKDKYIFSDETDGWLMYGKSVIIAYIKSLNV